MKYITLLFVLAASLNADPILIVSSDEGKIIAICKEAGIDCSFKNGKLYVDKGDVADAKEAIKADDDIIKLPEGFFEIAHRHAIDKNFEVEVAA